LKLECLSSSSSSSSSSSFEFEITDYVSFIEGFENIIKFVEELNIEERLDNILNDLNDQLSSIENLSNELNSQDYLPKDPYETKIQTYIPNIPNYLFTLQILQKEQLQILLLLSYFSFQ
jgi:hypothetical protein